jgi:hypothetical protein
MMHWVPEKWLAFAVIGRFGQEIRDFMAACYHWAQKKRDVHRLCYRLIFWQRHMKMNRKRTFIVVLIC